MCFSVCMNGQKFQKKWSISFLLLVFFALLRHLFLTTWYSNASVIYIVGTVWSFLSILCRSYINGRQTHTLQGIRNILHESINWSLTLYSFYFFVPFRLPLKRPLASINFFSTVLSSFLPKRCLLNTNNNCTISQPPFLNFYYSYMISNLGYPIAPKIEKLIGNFILILSYVIPCHNTITFFSAQQCYWRYCGSQSLSLYSQLRIYRLLTPVVQLVT